MAYIHVNNSEPEKEFPKILTFSSHRDRGGWVFHKSERGRRQMREKEEERKVGRRKNCEDIYIYRV